MRARAAWCLAVVAGFAAGFGLGTPLEAQAPAAPLLLQRPTVSKTQIAFSYGGDIWTVPRAGGAATRVTAAEGCNATDQLIVLA